MVMLNKLQFGVHTVHGKPMHLLLLCLKFSFLFFYNLVFVQSVMGTIKFG